MPSEDVIGSSVRWGQAARFMPGVVSLAAWLFWIVADGGYFPADYLPVGLLAAVFLAIVVGAGRSGLPPRGAGREPLLIFAAIVLFGFLSTIWADSRGHAFDASVELLVLLAVSWLVAVTPWNARRAALMVGAWSIGAASIAAVALSVAATGDGSLDVIRYGRFSEPIGYTNGIAALGVMAFLPAAALSARRETPAALQGFLLAAACFLLELALLTQSRAAVLALAIGIPLLVLFSPGRLALLARLGVLAAAVVFALGPVLDVYQTAVGGGDSLAALRSAAKAMGLTSLAAGAAGVAVAVVQRVAEARVSLPRLDRRLLAVATVVGVVALAIFAVLAANRIESGWQQAADSALGDGSARIGSFDPEERLDYWRVSLDMFERSPVSGRGAGSFEYNYARDRREAKPSRYAHNVFLRALGEGGLIGLVALLAVIVTAAFSMFNAWRRSAPLGRSVIGACAVTGACFLVHSSLDWMDEIPALAAPALGLILMSCRLAAAEAEPIGTRSRRSRRLLGVTAAATLFAVLTIGASWLSTLYLSRGNDRLASEPGAAFADFSRAADLRPWSAGPLLSEGVAAVLANDGARAEKAFREAIEREDSAFPHLELALLASEKGIQRRAKAQIAAAMRIEPRDLFIRHARRQIWNGARIDAKVFNQRLLGIQRRRFAAPVS